MSGLNLEGPARDRLSEKRAVSTASSNGFHSWISINNYFKLRFLNSWVVSRTSRRNQQHGPKDNEPALDGRLHLKASIKAGRLAPRSPVDSQASSKLPFDLTHGFLVGIFRLISHTINLNRSVEPPGNDLENGGEVIRCGSDY